MKLYVHKKTHNTEIVKNATTQSENVEILKEL